MYHVALLIFLCIGNLYAAEPKTKITLLYEEADKDKDDERWVIAIKKFEYLESRVKPQNKPLIWFDLGVCYMMQGDKAKGFEYLTKLVEAKDDIKKLKDRAFGDDLIGKSYYWLAEIERHKRDDKDHVNELRYRELAESSGLIYYANTERMADLYRIKADAMYEVENPQKPEYLDLVRKAKECSELWPKQRDRQIEELHKKESKDKK